MSAPPPSEWAQALLAPLQRFIDRKHRDAFALLLDTARKHGRRERDAEVAQARADERRAIVADLRAESSRLLSGIVTEEDYVIGHALAQAADRYERGAPMPPEKPDAE